MHGIFVGTEKPGEVGKVLATYTIRHKTVYKAVQGDELEKMWGCLRTWLRQVVEFTFGQPPNPSTGVCPFTAMASGLFRGAFTHNQPRY